VDATWENVSWMGFLGHYWYANFMSTLWCGCQEQVIYHTNLISCLQPKLAKSSYGWSPLWQHHKINPKKTLAEGPFNWQKRYSII
jgi:hypothetical protein